MSKQNGAVAPNSPSLTPVDEFTYLRLHGRTEALESSGRVVTWRPVNLTRLLKAGRVPDHLTAFVTTVVWAGKEEDDRPALEQAVEWQDYLDWMASEVLTRPAVIYGKKNIGDILPEDLFAEELLELERKGRKPLEAVNPFPVKQAADVGIGTESGEVVKTA